MVYIFWTFLKRKSIYKFNNNQIGGIIMSTRVYRLDPKSKTKQFPYTRNGFYVLGDPAYGKKNTSRRIM